MDMLLYDFESTDAAKPIKIGDQRPTGLEDLDPSLELAVDFKDFIASNGTGDIFTDIFQPSPELPSDCTKLQPMPFSIPSSEYTPFSNGLVKSESHTELTTLDLGQLLHTPVQNSRVKSELVSPGMSNEPHKIEHMYCS